MVLLAHLDLENMIHGQIRKQKIRTLSFSVYVIF
jgi:hypothetical protein